MPEPDSPGKSSVEPSLIRVEHTSTRHTVHRVAQQSNILAAVVANEALNSQWDVAIVISLSTNAGNEQRK